MKLNLIKCLFGIYEGMLLAFIMIQTVIKANLDKIKALIEMQSPICKKDVQKLTRKVAALNRFVSSILFVLYKNLRVL